ncbi:MAG TPA: TIGR03118 family protein [Terracidiphilus sp.]|nr:TIGR03118 family protein [Terracidiphilus sp.]
MKVKARTILFVFFLAGCIGDFAAPAQSNNYTQTNLVSNVPGLALTRDDDLAHPWGMAVSSGQAFRIAANGKGKFKSYDASGTQQNPRGIIAVPDGVILPASPTGLAANTTGEFTSRESPLPLPFLFATRQGTISGEYADSQGDIKTTTILVADHSSQGAEYTGLALLTPDCCAPYLAAADFHRGFVETFTPFFDPLGIPGAFSDPNLPAGFSPWNLQVVKDHVFIAYALQDVAQHNPLPGAGSGFVDEYNLDGSFVRRFASTGPLNVPSAIVQASANFGAFSNDILIGNTGDGFINAFDPTTGQYLGALKDGNGNPIVNQQLHSMFFGDGTAGNADTLYLTAAPGGETSGIFAAINVNTSGGGPDFSLSSDRQSVTVAPGQIGDFSVKATPAGNFRSAFSFSCNAPAAVACNVSAPSFDPATGSAVVAVTATATRAAAANVVAGFLPVLLMGMSWRKRRRFFYGFLLIAAGLVSVSMGLTGCGSYGGGKIAPPPTAQNFSVTASAGSVSHTTVLTLNVQ